MRAIHRYSMLTLSLTNISRTFLGFYSKVIYRYIWSCLFTDQTSSNMSLKALVSEWENAANTRLNTSITITHWLWLAKIEVAVCSGSGSLFSVSTVEYLWPMSALAALKGVFSPLDESYFSCKKCKNVISLFLLRFHCKSEENITLNSKSTQVSLSISETWTNIYTCINTDIPL